MRRLFLIWIMLCVTAGCHFKPSQGKTIGHEPSGNAIAFPDSSVGSGFPKPLKDSRVFIPAVRRDGSIVEFCDRSNVQTLVSYDLSKLVDIDRRVDGNFAIAEIRPDEEREVEGIIDSAIKQAFREGYYADYYEQLQEYVLKPDRGVLSIGKPVQVQVRNEGSLSRLYDVPVVWDRRIVAIARVGFLSNESEPQALQFLFLNRDVNTLTGDGIIPTYSKDTVLDEISHSSNTARYQTQGISANSKIERSYLRTSPGVGFDGEVWTIGTPNGIFIMDEKAKIYRIRSTYGISSLGFKLPNGTKVSVDPF